MFLNMKDRLSALGVPLSASAGDLLIQHRFQRRAYMAALSMEGIDHRTIAVFTETHPSTVGRWTCRLQEGQSLKDRPRSGRPRRFCESMRLSTIAVYCQQCPPLPGIYQWSLRDAHRYFQQHPECIGASISRATIQRILAEHVIQPHRRQYYLQTTDPDFFPKMERVIHCYLYPPQNLYCYDECTCIQALERLSPDLGAQENQPVLRDFDYRRHGITDLLACLNPATGKLYGRCTPNHDRHVFCRFFTDHVQTHPPEAVVHYIMDNLNTHYHDDFCQTVAQLSGVHYSPLKTGAERREWLQSEDKRIVVHFLPFHASWLNMVEIWFGILKRKCLNYDHFHSVAELRAAITAFIDTWNEFFAHPFNWSYTGEGLHAKAVRRFCRLLAIQSNQMDCKFLTNQMLLMSNIADNSLQLIPPADWLLLRALAAEKDGYINHIIDADAKPRRKKKAREAYSRFVQTLINTAKPLTKAA